MGFDLSIPTPVFIRTEEEAAPWLDYYLRTHRQSDGIGLDSETTGVDKTDDRILFWSLANDVTRIAIMGELVPFFRPLLENPEVAFDLTNAKFDAHMFANSGIDITLARELRCTTVQSWLFNENRRGRHGLKECVQEFLGRRRQSFEEVFGKLKKERKKKKKDDDEDDEDETDDEDVYESATSRAIRNHLSQPGSEKFVSAVDYASQDPYDSHALRKFFDYQLSLIECGPGRTLRDYFYEVEVPFTKVLWKMERRGITVDVGYLREREGPLLQKMSDITKEFSREANRLINLKSATDVRHFFFEILKKEPIEWTSGGKSGIPKPSTKVEVLEEYAGEGDQWANRLMRHRKYSKTYGTYIKGMINRVHAPYDYRIRTTLKQNGAVTGRLSSTDPNLQNIPRPDEDEDRIRAAFIAAFRKVLLVADYAQLEMRLMAHFSGDAKMIHAILNKIDLHCLTVSEMEGIPYEEVMEAVKADKLHKKGKGTEPTERQSELVLKRQNAKSTGFGIIYGMGGPSLAAKLTRETGVYMPPEGGTNLIQRYLNVFPGMRRHIEQTKLDIMKTGVVRTMLGRYRRLGETKAMSKKDAASAERQGVNCEIQGTAADIAKVVMIKAENDPILQSLGVELLLQIHDELVFECDDDEAIIVPAKKRVQEIMESPFPEPLEVPLPVEIGHGYSWAEAK